MYRVAALLLSIAVLTAAGAEAWVDANGVVFYTDLTGEVCRSDATGVRDLSQPDEGGTDTATWLYYDSGTASSGNGFTSTNYQAVRFTQPTTGYVNKVRADLFSTAGRFVVVEIWTDVSGAPGAKIWESDPYSLPADWSRSPGRLIAAAAKCVSTSIVDLSALP